MDSGLRLQCPLTVCPKENCYPGGCPTDNSACKITRVVKPLGRIKGTLWGMTEKAMAPHSSTLAWKIPWMEEPGGLQSMGSLRVGHD